MKIQKVEKLNHARFHNYSWGPTLVDFADGVNLLFGWNGSGKTTFSNVLRSLENGIIENSCTFKIKTESSQITDTCDLNLTKNNIRIFNGNYIEETLRGSSTIPYIFFAGKEAVSYDAEEQKLKDKKDELNKIILPTKHDDIASATAVVIKEVGGINSIKKQLVGAGTYASYSKTDFEKRIADIEKKIADGKIKSHAELIRADVDSLKGQLMNTERLAKNDNEIANAAKWLIDNIENINNGLGSQPVQVHSKRIDDLNETQTGWIKQGVSLHFNQEKPLAKCLFCNSDISNTEELIKHFSDEVVKTINSIDEYLKIIEGYTTSFAKLDSLSKSQQQNVDFVRAIFDALAVILKEKRTSISVIKTAYTLDITKLTPMTNPTSTDATSVAYAIETHFVAQQYEEYARAKELFAKATDQRSAITLEISKLDTQVKELKQKVKNTLEPAQALNRLFKVVFPYRKIEITDADDGKGYALKRDETNCAFSSLSEGEKNFIALAYFIYSINDAQNKLPDDGVVVIDDPVSSLDKQAIFQIFSIIVNEIKNHAGRQYFVLTHNLDFLGHLREHFRSKIGSGDVRLFSFAATSNGCIIEAIHPLLRDHRSDYYYVFSVLAKHKDTCDLEDAHLVVNLLRRWLETFLEFKFSTTGDLRSTLESAYSSATKTTEKETNPFSANPLEMYRFINHGSHGFIDPESIDDSILTNAHQRIQEAFQLVKILDPLHYKKLEGISNI